MNATPTAKDKYVQLTSIKINTPLNNLTINYTLKCCLTTTPQCLHHTTTTNSLHQHTRSKRCRYVLHFQATLFIILTLLISILRQLFFTLFTWFYLWLNPEGWSPLHMQNSSMHVTMSSYNYAGMSAETKLLNWSPAVNFL